MGSSEHRCVLTGQLPDQEEHAVRDHGPPPENPLDPANDAAAPAPAPDSTYAFGDTDVEAARLALVTEVFGPTSEELLTQAVEHPPVLAYDLGCGPGHTTRLVARATGAALTVGQERSAAHLARARAGAPKGARFVTWDVAELPFPTGPADLVYARLLLAHLEDPVAVALSWTTQLNVGGLLVVDEARVDRDRPPRSPGSPTPRRLARSHYRCADVRRAAPRRPRRCPRPQATPPTRGRASLWRPPTQRRCSS